MNAKRTKRLRDDETPIALEDHIRRQRELLVRDRNRVPQLRASISDITERVATMTAAWQYRLRADLLRRITALEREIEILLSMEREHAFERMVVVYLRQYHSTIRRGESDTSISATSSSNIQAYVQQMDRTHQHRTSIVDEYLTEMSNAPAKVRMTRDDVCPRCSTHPSLLLNAGRSILSCPECGYAITYLDATSSSTSFEEQVEFSQYSYKRVTHYLTWLQLLQGKETHRVSNDIIEAVMEDLFERLRIRRVSDVNQRIVRDSLRHLKLKRAYDHVSQITCRITGELPPRITPRVEEKLKNMFLQMQPAFQRHAPKSRTNFLSYSFVLYRCFQILGLHEMLSSITLLKGRDKLEANDAIFRRMCVDLGWPVFDLPST